MKVSTWKNIDVDVDVDVSLDDCIDEMIDKANSEDDRQHLKISAIDGATRVLEKVTPEMVSEVLKKNPGAIDMIRQRIQKCIDAT